MQIAQSMLNQGNSITASHPLYHHIEAGLVLIDNEMSSDPENATDRAKVWCDEICKRYGFVHYSWHWMENMKEFESLSGGSPTRWILQFEDRGLFKRGALGPLILFVENGIRGYIINSVSVSSQINTGRKVLPTNVRSHKDIFKMIKEQFLGEWLSNHIESRFPKKNRDFEVWFYEFKGDKLTIDFEFDDPASEISLPQMERNIEFVKDYMLETFKLRGTTLQDISDHRWLKIRMTLKPAMPILA